MAEELTQLSVPNFPKAAKERLEQEAQAQDRPLASLLRSILLSYTKNLDAASDVVESLSAEGLAEYKRTGVIPTISAIKTSKPVAA